MSDATLNSLAQFDDPTKWVVKSDVPIFREHIATLPDGKPMPIDRTELTKFAAELQRLEKNEGVPARLTIGHTLSKDPKTGQEPKETDQPPLVGFARNARMGVYGPKQIPGVLVDYWYRKADFDKYDLANQYPYRSPEVYLSARQITGVALLKRDPKLDMGMTLFNRPSTYHHHNGLTSYHRADGATFYALDDECEATHMAEPTTPTMPAEPAAPAAPAANPAPEEDGLAEIQQHLMQMSPEEVEAFCAQLKHMHAEVHGGQPGATPTPESKPAMTANQRTTEVSQYARENAELKSSLVQLQKQVGTLTHKELVTERSDELRLLDRQGYTVVDKDYDKAARYSKDQWGEHLDEIKANRQRHHGADTLLTLSEEGGDAELPSEEERAERRAFYQREQKDVAILSRFDKVMNYMRDKGVTYEVADKAVDKHGNVRKTA